MNKKYEIKQVSIEGLELPFYKNIEKTIEHSTLRVLGTEYEFTYEYYYNQNGIVNKAKIISSLGEEKIEEEYNQKHESYLTIIYCYGKPMFNLGYLPIEELDMYIDDVLVIKNDNSISTIKIYLDCNGIMNRRVILTHDNLYILNSYEYIVKK